MLPVDTLRISDHYEISFLEQYGEDIKRIVIPDHCASYSINDLMLSKCPNVEEFIIGKDTAFSFLNGVLYSNSGNKRSIKYIIKGTKEVHIDADITGISYWHGVDSVTIDKGNSTFVVQDHMLLSRRKNSLYFVFSAAEEVIIPEGVTAIHAYAFKYCDNLKKIVFPASYNWSGWYNSPTGPILYINDAMRDAEIIINGDKARYDNHLIMNNPNALSQSIYLYLGDPELCFIPANITSVHSFNKAFYNAKNFKVDENNPFLASVDGVILDKARRELLLYPPARDYFRIPTSVKVIKSHSVSACNAITDVVLPEHVDSLEMMAFSNCNCLKKVTKMNPKADIHKDAFFGCNLLNNKEEKPIDTQALMKELDQEIQKIKEASVPKEKKRQARSKKSKQAARKEFKFNDHVSFNLSEEFIISQDIDEEGNQKTELKWEEYFNEDTGETQYKFSASIKEMEANTEEYGKIPDSKELIDSFISGVPSEYVSRSFKDFANLPCAFVSIETPIEVPLGFLGNIVLKRYLVNFGVVSDGKIVCISADGYQNKDNDEHIEEEDILYEKMLEIIEGLSVDGEHIDLRGLDEKKLREEIEPIFSDSESTFSFGLEMPEEPLPEVRFAEDDDRKVIVDNKWSFTLPKGIELRFDSEHVDIMGNNTTAKYVLEGLEYNGRFFFDFELMQRTDFGMGNDLDVIGCRYDNAVKSENANQRIILDGDDLYVDLVSKPIFLFRSMVILRVRGDGLNPWDFQMGLDNMDQNLSDRWDEIAASLNELATSITFLDTGKKTAKKKTTKKKTDSNPDFVISNGVLRKYIGKATDIVIPDGVKEIADSTFSGYTKLKSIVVPEGVKKIGRRCFENCFALEHVTLPESLQELGGYAFVDCHELKEIYLSEKLKVLGDSAFSECFKLQNVQIPKKIKEIDAFVFKNCDSFTHIVVPNGVTKIGFSAFVGCDNLEYLFIPKSVKEFQMNINNHPFAYCPKLTIYTPAGSPMQKFAEEQSIPYENANRGVLAAKSEEKSKTCPVVEQKSNVINKAATKKTAVKTETKGIPENQIKMFVLLDDYDRAGPIYNKKEFCDKYEELFPDLKRGQLSSLVAEVQKTRKKKEFKSECTQLFMERPVKYRFDISTKNCFLNSEIQDYRDKKTEAILYSKKWFKPEELNELERLLDSEMERIKKNLIDQFKDVDVSWEKFYLSKQDLYIVIEDYESGKKLEEDKSLFQGTTNDFLSSRMGVYLIKIKGFLEYSVLLGNYMPWIWGVSVDDIWKQALNNGVLDRRSLPFDSKEFAQEQKDIFLEKIHESEKKASILVRDIKRIYEDCLDSDKAKQDITDVLDKLFFLRSSYPEARLRAIEKAKEQKFSVLCDVLEKMEPYDKFEKTLKKAITKDIPKRQAEKLLNNAKKGLNDAKQAISDSERSIQECEKALENDRKLLEEKKRALADYQILKGTEFEEDKARITTQQNSQKEVVNTVVAHISDLKKMLEDAQQELKNTSFFKFSRKKELSAKIEDLNAKINNYDDELSEERSKLTALDAEYKIVEQNYKQEQDRLKKDISDCEMRIRTNTLKLSDLNSLIANKKEEAAKLEDKLKELEKKKKRSSK